MKEKDVKKLLQADSAKILPDDRIKEEIRRDLGIEDEVRERELALAGGGAERVKKNRSNLIAAVAALLIVVLCAAFLLPVLFRKEKGNLTGGNKLDGITTTDEFYAYGAASVGALLAESSAGNGMRALSLSFARTEQDHTEFEKKVTEYLALAESLLSEGNIEHETETGGGYGDYEFAMTITFQDILGETVVYHMYYDKQFLAGETDGDEREEKFSITGVLAVGEAVYPVSGRYETESEGDEQGEELSFRAYTGENSYIMVEQEREQEGGTEAETEKEYVYTVVENGQRLERTVVEYEQEEGETEVKMTVENYSGGEKVREDVLEFWEESGRKGVLHVKADIGGERTECLVFVREGTERYEFVYGALDDDDD